MKINLITVIHTAFLMTRDDEGNRTFDRPQVVGLVNVGEREGTEALEFAFEQTQNIEESWTKNSSVDTFVRGAEYRSTSVGDRMIFNGDIYRVGSVGFQNVMDMANADIHTLIEEDENHFRGQRLDQ
tara:strand:- start:378 stop:758 length:381 start_codon:yes stop_codon:yes gene_type:complete